MPPLPTEHAGGAAGGDSSSQRTLPEFLMKTYELVDDSSVNDLISWNGDGTSFIVWKPEEFSRNLLPNYFKHDKFSSFVRQLSTYGFKKIASDRFEFFNHFFKRGEKRLLREIQRRKWPPPPELVAENERLRRENAQLHNVINRLRGSCPSGGLEGMVLDGMPVSAVRVDSGNGEDVMPVRLFGVTIGVKRARQ